MENNKPDYRPDLIEYKQSNSLLIGITTVCLFVLFIVAYWFFSNTKSDNRSELRPSVLTQTATVSPSVITTRTQPRASGPARLSQRNNASNSIMYRCVNSSGVISLQDSPCPQESVSAQQIRSSIPRNNGIRPNQRISNRNAQQSPAPGIAVIRNIDAEIAKCQAEYNSRIERLERTRRNLRNQSVNKEIDRLVRERQACIDRVRGIQTSLR